MINNIVNNVVSTLPIDNAIPVNEISSQLVNQKILPQSILQSKLRNYFGNQSENISLNTASLHLGEAVAIFGTYVKLLASWRVLIFVS